MIHDYKEFQNDFMELFKNLLADFNYSSVDYDNSKITSKKSEIIFEISESGALDITIVNINNDHHYNLFWLNLFYGHNLDEEIYNKYFSLLEPEEKTMGNLRGSVRFDMRYESEFLSKNYYKMLNGDFSWESEFDKWLNWINHNWQKKSEDETPPSYEVYLKLLNK